MARTVAGDFGGFVCLFFQIERIPGRLYENPALEIYKGGKNSADRNTSVSSTLPQFAQQPIEECNPKVEKIK